MKKTSKRTSSGNRGLNRFTDLGVTTDDSVLADLRATRDDTDLRVMPLSSRSDDEDAIDRLLANSGFEKTVTSIVQAADMASDKLSEPLTAIDDFEPEASAYKVMPMDQDPHLQVRPVELEPDRYGWGLKADRHAAEAVGVALVSSAPEFAETDVMRMFDDSSNHHSAEGEDAVLAAVPAPALAIDASAMNSRPEPTQSLWVTKVEPIVAKVSGPDLVPPLGQAADRVATVQDIPVTPLNDPDSGSARRAYEEPWQDNDVTPAVANVADSEAPPYRCEYKAEQARINVLALVLGIVASLAALVCYFLLMDMRNDLNKLNEMVEIMKEDIQMNRQEPPVE